MSHMGNLPQAAGWGDEVMLSELQGYGPADLQREAVSGKVDNLTGGPTIWLGDEYNRIGVFSNNLTINGGSDWDVVDLLGPSRISIQDVEEVNGSTGIDTVKFLGDEDSFNMVWATDVERFIGSKGTDAIVLSPAQDNDIAITQVEQVFGGPGMDTIRLGNAGNDVIALDVDVIEGGAGYDKARIADSGNFVNFVRATNMEELQGGDTAIDIVQLYGERNRVQVSRMEFASGGEGDDYIEVTTPSKLNIDVLFGDTEGELFTKPEGTVLLGGAGNDTLIGGA
jgi:Ca2+-binding RTX toxin-like protein